MLYFSPRHELTQLLASSSKDLRVIPGRIKPLRGGVISSFSTKSRHTRTELGEEEGEGVQRHDTLEKFEFSQPLGTLEEHLHFYSWFSRDVISF